MDGIDHMLSCDRPIPNITYEEMITLIREMKQAAELFNVKAKWLKEILHVVQGFADREHEGPLPQLVPAHASNALAFVPREILYLADISEDYINIKPMNDD